MSETKQTPGPWSFIIHGSKVEIDSPQQPLGKRYIGSLRGTSETDQANARLIASAPELLEALEFMVDAAKTEPGMNIYKAHIEQACQAINKAKGE